jgi:hypothetical protein
MTSPKVSDSDSHDSDPDDIHWVEVTENNDNQPQANFQYQELHGSKQPPPPANVKPVAYFLFIFYDISKFHSN